MCAWHAQRDLPWELDSRLRTLGRSSLGASLGGPANFGSHCRVTTEAHGSRRLIGSSFREGLLAGELTFLEYDEHMRLLHRSSAPLPVQLSSPGHPCSWNMHPLLHALLFCSQHPEVCLIYTQKYA
jgi:hypothetical protein